MASWRNVFPSVRCLSIRPLIHSFRGGTYHIQYLAPLDHHSKGSAALISISSRILCHFVTTAGVEPALCLPRVVMIVLFPSDQLGHTKNPCVAEDLGV